MNQILLQVLSQDPLKTPGIYLSFRWLLPLIPLLDTFGRLFVLPLLATWLGHIFLDTYDLWDQVFSVTGMIYVSILVGMIPKPNTSSRLWMDANLFTVVYYLLYFVELQLVAYYGIEFEYSVSWLASITFSTTFTFLFYAILLKFGLSTLPYFKTIVRVYLLTDVGTLFAVGLLTPYFSTQIILFVTVVFLIYLLLPHRNPYKTALIKIFPTDPSQNFMILRCMLWGALSVWSDYLDMAPFYVLEVILGSESYKKKDSVVYHLKEAWKANKTTILGNVMKIINTLPAVGEIILKILINKRIILKHELVRVLSQPTHLIVRSSLYSRNL